MAAQVTTIDIATKLGAKLDQSIKKHGSDETKVSGGGDLPEIDFGIAQLVDIKIGEYKPGTKYAGEAFFFAAGVVKSPKKAQLKDGTLVAVEGLRTQIGPEPICDKKGAKGEITSSFDQQVAKVLNYLRLLGYPTKGMAAKDLMAAIGALLKIKPHFQFRTWSAQDGEIEQLPNGKVKFKNSVYPSEAACKVANPYAGMAPRMNHDWRGTCSYVPDEAGTHVQDNSGDADSSEPGHEEHEEAVNTSSGTEETTSEEESQDIPFGNDWDDAVADANSANPGEKNPAAKAKALAAQKKLASAAMGVGYSQDDVDNSESWEQVAQWIREAAVSEGEEAARGDSEPEGDHGDAIDYFALGEAAENGDQDSADQLNALREGVLDDDAFAAMSWAELAQSLHDNAVGLELAGDPESWSPQTEQIYGYKGLVLDTKTKTMKRSTTADDHEIVSVGEDTVTLKSLSTGKVLMDMKTKKPLQVPWTDLVRSE